MDQVVSITEGASITGDLPCPLVLHFDDHVADQTASINSQAVISIGSIDNTSCLLYTSPSPRDRQKSRMPSSA